MVKLCAVSVWLCCVGVMVLVLVLVPLWESDCNNMLNVLVIIVDPLLELGM